MATAIIDNYKEHELHIFPDPKCSTCFSQEWAWKNEKLAHKDCRHCHGSLIAYVPDGECVSGEDCPALSETFIKAMSL